MVEEVFDEPVASTRLVESLNLDISGIYGDALSKIQKKEEKSYKLHGEQKLLMLADAKPINGVGVLANKLQKQTNNVWLRDSS